MIELAQELKASCHCGQTPPFGAAYYDPYSGFYPFVAPSVRLDAHEARSLSCRRRIDHVAGSPSFNATFFHGDQTARA
ncbi:MAG: hypothetical protein ACP5O0_04750 [Acidimicrobiales bacterium]